MTGRPRGASRSRRPAPATPTGSDPGQTAPAVQAVVVGDSVRDDLRVDLLHYLTRMCVGDEERAEELTAEAIARVWSARDRITTMPAEDQRRYAFTIARNVLVDDCGRVQRARVVAVEPDTLIADAPDADEPPAEVDELAGRALEIIAELSEIEQKLIRLRFFDGLPYDDIGGRLQLNPKTARVMLHRALQNVRARMGQP